MSLVYAIADPHSGDGRVLRAALQRWADHVDRIVSGEALDNVVEMRGR